MVLLILALIVAYDRGLLTWSQAGPASAAQGASARDHGIYHNRTFRVAHVVDGDTMDINAPDGTEPLTRVRLWGVDAPETRGIGGRPMHFGPESATFARTTLDNSEVQVVLSPKRTRDKYGRLLAYIFLQPGGVMFNERLVEQGYAYADRRFPHHYRERFESAETRARRTKVGLWADLRPDDTPEWYRRVTADGSP